MKKLLLIMALFFGGLQAQDGVLEGLGLVPLSEADRKAVQDKLAQSTAKFANN